MRLRSLGIGGCGIVKLAGIWDALGIRGGKCYRIMMLMVSVR